MKSSSIQLLLFAALCAVLYHSSLSVYAQTEIDATSWTSCVGIFTGITYWNTCPLFNKPLLSGFTVQMRVIQEYFTVLLTSDFAAADPLFSETSVYNVPAFGLNFVGKEVVLGYLQLASPYIQDLQQIVSFDDVTFTQEGMNLGVTIQQTVKNLQTGISYPNPQVWLVQFNDMNQIQQIDTFVDATALEKEFSVNQFLNASAFCGSIATVCTGNYTQFPVASGPLQNMTCEEFVQTIPLKEPNNYIYPYGNTLGCRNFHLTLAKVVPSVHCLHAGALKQNAVTTPCNNWP
jgi:hypothetical protein